MKSIACVVAALLTGSAGAASAQSVNYSCLGNKSVTVDYTMGEATMSARVTLDGKARELHYSDASDAETIVLESGVYKLTVVNTKRLQTAEGMSITKSGAGMVNGKKMRIHEILYKSCNPT